MEAFEIIWIIIGIVLCYHFQFAITLVLQFLPHFIERKIIALTIVGHGPQPIMVSWCSFNFNVCDNWKKLTKTILKAHHTHTTISFVVSAIIINCSGRMQYIFSISLFRWRRFAWLYKCAQPLKSQLKIYRSTFTLVIDLPNACGIAASTCIMCMLMCIIVWDCRAHKNTNPKSHAHSHTHISMDIGHIPTQARNDYRTMTPRVSSLIS